MELARKDMLQRWLQPLVRETGRDVDELLRDGLSATNFPFEGIRIEYEDGSVVAFKYAFAVRDAALPGRVGVFTEHCGYHEFALTADDVLRAGIPPSGH